MQQSITQVDPELQTEPVSPKSGQMLQKSNQNLKERVVMEISNLGIQISGLYQPGHKKTSPEIVS